MMRFQILKQKDALGIKCHINIDKGYHEFTSFPAEIGNTIYDSFLESQSLTNDEVQAMEPDVWHDMV